MSKRRQGREARVVARPAALEAARGLLDAYEQLWRERVERMGAVLDEEREGGA